MRGGGGLETPAGNEVRGIRRGRMQTGGVMGR